MQVDNHQSSDQQQLDITLGRLKELSRSERVLLGLYVYEQLSIEDIAQVLQLSTEIVESQLGAIIAKVTAPLGDPGSASEKIVSPTAAAR